MFLVGDIFIYQFSRDINLKSPYILVLMIQSIFSTRL